MTNCFMILKPMMRTKSGQISIVIGRLLSHQLLLILFYMPVAGGVCLVEALESILVLDYPSSVRQLFVANEPTG